MADKEENKEEKVEAKAEVKVSEPEPLNTPLEDKEGKYYWTVKNGSPEPIKIYTEYK